MKTLITGITGQDGSYLSELLLEKGYEVHGLVRRTAAEYAASRHGRVKHLVEANKLTLHGGDITDLCSIIAIMQKVQPDEIYHLAAQSFVAASFEDQFSTMSTNINGTHNMLYATKEVCPKAKFYFAGSSEQFGKVVETPQSEKTPFYPRSIYAVAKVAGFDLVRNYREAHGLFACSGILFNHESPRRGTEFVTRKITSTIGKIKAGLAKELVLGNLNARRDWGYSPEYCQAMFLMLQHEHPDDYVVATGETHSIEEFVQYAFSRANLDWKEYTKYNDAAFNRPSDVELLLGDASKAHHELGWYPKTKFHDLVNLMVDADVQKWSHLIDEKGHQACRCCS